MVNLSEYAFLATDAGALDKGKTAVGKVKVGRNKKWVGFIRERTTMMGTQSGQRILSD